MRATFCACVYNLWYLQKKGPVAECFVTKVTKRVKSDALPARFVSPARFVTT